MKRSFLAIAGGCLSAFIWVSSVSAQDSRDVNSKTYGYQKTPPINNSQSVQYKSQEGNQVNAKAVRDFQRNYKDAQNVRWHQVSDGYIADFQKSGEPIKVAYDLKGHWQYALKSGDESKLPPDIRALVRSTYYDYTIIQVEQLDLADKTVYLVQMGDKSSWKELRICDYEMEVIENYSRSNPNNSSMATAN